MKLPTNLLIPLLACSVVASAIVQAQSKGHGSQPGADTDWSQLIGSMEKMHMSVAAIQRSGNDDVDFVRLMLPHHRAAVDMAKAQLMYGKDPEMRKLAQEIITAQQSEINLMRHWLKEQPAQVEINPTPGPTPAQTSSL
ncbi:MAG: hypothetical protein QOH01_958 [Verrucomicrobiota bacterium]